MTAARIAYISFDTVPAPKGAATHIEAFARALAGEFGGVELVTVAPGAEASLRTERWPGVFHSELPAMGESLIDRVLCFRGFLKHWLRGRQFEAIQFRSIFEGLPLLELAPESRLVFEVNGLPSIELKYRYPGMEDDRELMRKILAQEQACLEAADLVVTPSNVTANYLASARRVPTSKIRVVPNGVDHQVFCLDRAASSPTFRMIYFGTLAPWQGIELGIRALPQICVTRPATLTVIGSGSGRELDALMSLAGKLGVGGQVRVLAAMPQSELAGHLCAADAVLAPLTLNDRNVLQGCCPLKVLEGMAAGVPVIASDLPVVRELGCHGVHFLLVKPGSVDQIALAALRLADDQELAEKIGEQARAHV
ncbi:MAG TPA: glycosyltransferase family 4 protein, partial [Bryobacteraceae bacterium]|nr:glycosyltransferase family 4 protein [Bryobacteraceae bacterium]